MASVLDVCCTGGWNLDWRNTKGDDEMSMNLFLTVDNREIDLWQTPTNVTRKCLTMDDGKVHWEVSGDNAVKALHEYLAWIDYSPNRELVKSETEEILAIINTCDREKIVCFMA